MTVLYSIVQQSSTFAGLCERYVEEQLTGRGGWYANAAAAVNAPDFRHTADPSAIPAGVAVVLSAAQSNGYEGHTGVSLGGGRMRSPWSNGEIVEEDIARFAADNAVSLLGYHNFGRGVPPAAPPAPTGAPPVPGLPPAAGKVAALAVAAALAYAAIDWALG